MSADDTPPAELDDRLCEPPPLDFPVVGIGASTGGLRALTGFFQALPPDSGMAFVVLLAPTSPDDGTAAAVLQQATPMPVWQVGEPAAVERNQVYLLPPHAPLSMPGGQLCVTAPVPRYGRQMAIDQFLRTLAQAHRERAIGILLSGAGTDGAAGLMAVKEHGGVTLAQAPDDAGCPDMPQHAIATGRVDLVLPAADMPGKLADLWANARQLELPGAQQLGIAAREPATVLSAETAETALHDVMARLRASTGHDFKHYKRAMLLRRLERRMQVTQQPHLAAYSDYFEHHPAEHAALLQDLLISVTQFFRDAEAFAALGTEIGRQLMGRSLASEPLRAWVPACATGEEAYSVAMLLVEQAEAAGQAPNFQVFASDIDERAITQARAGNYPDSIAADLSPTRLRRFFDRQQGRYVVKKSLRERVLFATHNLLHDPPFSRMDLVCCRNLLIYLDRAIRQQVLEVLHFALRPGALLFLGSSESAELASRMFAVVDARHRIHRSHPAPQGRRQWLPMAGQQPLPTLSLPVHAPAARACATLHAEALHDQALRQHAPPSVLVEADGTIVHVSERAGRFLRYGPGAPTHRLLDAVLPELRPELRTALFEAQHAGHGAQTRPLRLQRGDTPVALTMTVRPVQEASRHLLLVMFDEVEATPNEPAPASSARSQEPLSAFLEEQVQRLSEQLQSSISQSEASTQELRTSNEELEASKEELQAVNEELIAVNHELKIKVDEAGEVNDDLQNLIASTDIATVFVDAAMRIKRYTPKATEIFNIIPGDVGRSLLDITHRLDYDDLAEDATQTFESLRVIEREVASQSGQTYLLRVLPYRTVEDRIDGAVLTFVEITALRKAEATLRSREERMRLVAESTKDFAIITMDLDGLITTWNHGAERIFGYREAEILGQPIDVLFTDEDRALGIPQQEMRRSREAGRAEDERWHRRKDGSVFFCSGVMTPLMEDGLQGYAKIGRDLTDRLIDDRRREAVLSAEQDKRSALQAANAMKDEFLAVLSHELKNPLNLIQMKAELLTRLPEVRDKPAVQRAADTIRRTVLSQAKIINDLLDLSRAHTGKFGLTCAPVPLRPLMERIVDAVRGDADARSLRLVFEMPGDALTAYGDFVRIEQILWNLLSNALKFTPPGGLVTVRLQREADWARIEVEDTGLGIEPTLLADVFDMFRQADTRIAREKGGLGIGLALVKNLAELHGGRAAAHSDGLGRGARFSVWLPLSMAVLPTPVVVPQETTPLNGLRLLVVDDTADTLETFGMLLELEGAQVTRAASAEEALAAADAGDFDLLLSDVAMPGMDGYELITALRRQPRHARLPAVAVTGFGRQQDQQRAVAAGFDAHIGKPVSIEALRELVANLRRRIGH